MNYLETIEEYVKQKCEEYKNSSDDKYDFWNEHIKIVYNQSRSLAVMYNADIEVVSIAALLHDIALVLKVGTKVDHHINGEKLAGEILDKFNYNDAERREKILKCILHHRSSKNATNIEEQCVADADILAHFNNIPMIFNLAYANKVSLNEIREWIYESFKRDYDDLSDSTKVLFKPKYEEILKTVLGEDFSHKVK